jgi:hypothetical protein
MESLGGFIGMVKLLKKIAERGIGNGLYRVKALLEETGSIPVYNTKYIEANSKRKRMLELLSF